MYNWHCKCVSAGVENRGNYAGFEKYGGIEKTDLHLYMHAGGEVCL